MTMTDARPIDPKASRCLGGHGNRRVGGMLLVV